MSAYRQEKALSGDAFSHVLGGRDETIVVAVHMRVLHICLSISCIRVEKSGSVAGAVSRGLLKAGMSPR